MSLNQGVRLVNKLSGEAKEVHLSKYTWLFDIDCSYPRRLDFVRDKGLR